MVDERLTLIDTSLWIEALRSGGDEKDRATVQEILEAGSAAWCEIIAIELWNSAKGKRELDALSHFQRAIPMLPISDEVWREARSLATKARSSGLSAPTVDIIIAACARHHNVHLAHKDRHLKLLMDL